MSSAITVTGWGKEAGPAYSVASTKLDRRRHKRVKTEEVVRQQNGRNFKGAAHAVVEHSGNKWLLTNRGHTYRVHVKTLGSELVGNLHSDDDYGVLLLEGDNAQVISVELVSVEDSGGDES